MIADPNFTSLWLSITALTAGLVMLFIGGELLVSSASKLAGKLGMSPLLIGLTVVAFGTSMPEMFVSVNAVLSQHVKIMFGNVVGSNIANVGLVLGICAMLSPLPINFQRLSREFYLVIATSIVLIFTSFYGYFPRFLGVLFVCALLFYTFYTCSLEKKNRQNSTSNSEIPKTLQQYPYILIALLCLSGVVLMWFGSDYFIKGAVDIALKIGISELVIGLTLAAVGTSLPELASSLSAIRKKECDILLGNILGSNLINLLFVLGGTAIIKPFYTPENAMSRDLPVMTAFSFILIPIALKHKKISRLSGSLLFGAYLLYIFSLR